MNSNDKFLAIFAVAVFGCIALLGISGVFDDSKNNPTWTYKVEDDAPRCWQNSDKITCGPLSWAPRDATIVNK